MVGKRRCRWDGFFFFFFLVGYYYYRYHGAISESEAECKNGVRGRGTWGTGTQGRTWEERVASCWLCSVYCCREMLVS